MIFVSACTMDLSPPPGGAPPSGNVSGDAALVTRVIDGDTIDVDINGVGYRVRYIGVNTPESDEACYSEATAANRVLVAGRTVTLVRDTSETDVYGRLLRYVYVGDDFVNADLVRDGWAENAEYPPDTAHAAEFHQLEIQARAANRGCHPTGIFDDGNETR
jgi:endonuclease YncB( thermonuclease family)